MKSLHLPRGGKRGTNIEAYQYWQESWDERSYVKAHESAPALAIIVTGANIVSLVYKLEPKLTQKQRELLSDEIRGSFEIKLDNNIAQNDGRI